jgi:protein phosphatase
VFEAVLDKFSTAKVVDFHLGHRSHVGMVRTLNEDSLLVLDLNRIQQSIAQLIGVFVIADGMGGHEAGEIASGTIIDTIARKALAELLPAQITKENRQDRLQWLREAVEHANKTVFDLRKSAGTDMGSTLVSSVVEGNTAHVAHVGDSRAYVINSQGIRQITTDHSLVERLIASNQISREEARVHPQRNVIYRTMGDKPKVDVEVSSHTLELNDHLLLCSDGLSGMLEDRVIYKTVMEAASPQAACDALIAAACAGGGEDNVSVIIIKIVQL